MAKTIRTEQEAIKRNRSATFTLREAGAIDGYQAPHSPVLPIGAPMVAPHDPLTFFGDKFQLLSAAAEPSADEPLRRLAWHVLMFPGRHSEQISIWPRSRYSSQLFECVSKLHSIEKEILRGKNASRSTLTHTLESLDRVFRHDAVKAIIRRVAAELGLDPSEAWEERLVHQLQDNNTEN
jgi:hypothetical protein